jgi:hypothetical protein
VDICRESVACAGAGTGVDSGCVPDVNSRNCVRLGLYRARIVPARRPAAGETGM